MRRFFTFTFLTVIVGVLFLAPVNRASADGGWNISLFDSKIAINTDGTVTVNEEIDAQFDTTKHGIYRDMPYAYKTSSGDTEYTNVVVNSVTENGVDEQYTTTQNGDNMRIQIGDPNVTVTGVQKYSISYTVTGILKSFDSYDELYWNSTGDQWGVPITKATAEVTLPGSGGVVQGSCYQGTQGSTDVCTYTKQDDTTATFASTREFAAGEGMTIAVGYTKGLVPILVGMAPVNPLGVTTGDVTKAGIAIIFGLALYGFLALRFMRTKGRDIGFHGRDTIMPIYDPPQNLRPAQMGLLVDEGTETVHISATIVDMAVRGYLTITEVPKKGIFGSTDYTLTLTGKPENDLMEYEQRLISTLFDGRPTVELSSLKNTFYKKLPAVKASVLSDGMGRQWFYKDPVKAKGAAGAVGAFLMVAGVSGTLIFGAAVSPFGFGLAVACLLSAFHLFVFVVRKMSTRTEVGHTLSVEIQGYKMYLSSVEKFRQPFMERQNIFMDVLPYAILFGVTQKLAKAFAEIGVVPPQPTWYYGVAPFNLIAFSQGLNTFTNTLSSTMASAPSSSGSGGGGFSGGGFGGGGGGSW